ncbi:hypothetical protein [uncultured Litoreibacter sp.]|uniref:hypothetical protein n=1 Tax=uncultured Litoreibacter sp. TaxID=1392394 RepID=UPI00262F5733|nr:hypothetical protein [uncultured Litoreibacter sp.]
MSFTIKSCALSLSLMLLMGCEEPGIPTLAKVGTKKLPDSTVTINGEQFPLKRAIALAGRKKGEEVWAIVYNGQAYSCSSATEIGCEFALSRAKKKERRERDMGY